MAKVFISYSHRDEDIKIRMVEHFSNLVRNGDIDIWDDRYLLAGEKFTSEIERQLLNSDIIMLLVSSKFLNSDYCWEKELPLALKLKRQGRAVVIPVIVSNCDWKTTVLDSLNAIPKDGKPIKDFGKRDDAFDNITQEIRRRANIINRVPEKIVHVTNKNSGKLDIAKAIFILLSDALGSLTLGAYKVIKQLTAHVSFSRSRKRSKKAREAERRGTMLMIFLIIVILVALAEWNQPSEDVNQSGDAWEQMMRPNE